MTFWSCDDENDNNDTIPPSIQILSPLDAETVTNNTIVLSENTIIDVDAKFSVAEISEEKYDLSVDFKPRKYVIKPAKEIIDTTKKKKKKKKKSIDDEW